MMYMELSNRDLKRERIVINSNLRNFPGFVANLD